MSFLPVIRTVFRTTSLFAPGLAAWLAARLFSRPMGRRVDLDEPTRLEIGGIIAQAQVEAIEVDDGSALLYRWPAPEPNSRRVLVLHGWTSSTDFMLHYVEGLREAGFEVAALDFPAHGRAPGKCLQHATAVAAIQAARDRLTPLHAQIGHSFGGAMSMMSLRGPDGQASITAPNCLVLVSSPARLCDVLDRFSEQIGLSDPSTARLKQRISDQIGQPLADLGASHAAHFFAGELTVIHSRDDREIPYVDALEIINAFDSATLHALDEAGHRRILKSPEAIRLIISALGTPQGPVLSSSQLPAADSAAP